VPNEPRSRIDRVLGAIGTAEDGIHLFVAVLLIGLSIALLVDSVTDVIDAFAGHYAGFPVVLNVLDKTLVLFIVAELLHTVRITLQHRGRLHAEPFLIVGLIAAVRRVLILTAQSEVSFRWNPDGIELLIMTALIVAMAASILVLRRTRRPNDEPSPT
jgi:uncharacterized membrane protein (DUF373 family)